MNIAGLTVDSKVAALAINHTPRFILRTSDFKIFDLTKAKSVRDDFNQQGYGIISYTWGRFQDKEVQETSSLAPTFDESVSPEMRWPIPKLKSQQRQSDPGFTIDQLRKVIESLKMLYVWWDWACIPQSWQTSAQIRIGPTDPNSGIVKAEEISKQSFIYTAALRGVIWVHDSVWTSDSNAKGYLQKLLELSDHDKLDHVAYVELLKNVVKSENWLTSMWTFQEGILLNCTIVVDPDTAQMIKFRGWDTYALLIDKTGAPLKSEKNFRPMATLLDMTEQVTLVACDLGMKITEAHKTGNTELANKLQEEVMDIFETGLVTCFAGSPLSTIESGKARGNPAYTAEEDYSVNALLGALKVTIPATQTVANLQLSEDAKKKEVLRMRKSALMSVLVERYQWIMILLTKPTRGSFKIQSVKTGSGDWLSILGKQWNFTSLDPFISTSLESPVPVDQSSYRYVQDRQATNSDGVRRWLDLPRIRHLYSTDPTSQVDAIIVQPGTSPSEEHPYFVFIYDSDPASQKQKRWSTCRFYGSESRDGTHRKLSRCAVQNLEFGKSSIAFGSESYALLPIEDVSYTYGRQPNSPVTYRCVVLGSFIKGSTHELGAAAGVFLGIGDFLFPENATEVSAKSQLGNTADWQIYMY